MAKGIVTRGGWTWRGRTYHEGDPIEAPVGQIRSWEREGYVERVAEPTRRPVRETADAPSAPENAAETTEKPPRYVGGGWYETADGSKVRGSDLPGEG